MLSATAWVERNAEQINALNVFPVPDGDTGSNMWLTLQSAVGEANALPENAGAGAVARAAAHGALMGARGNSGVILSQLLRGIARGLDDISAFDASDLALALVEGAATAYRGVIKPVEGTILTVARESAEAARQALVEGPDVIALLEVAVTAGRESLARTPSLLPVLAEAGVVDAGGKGYLVFLEGWLRHHLGDTVETGLSSPAVVGVEAVGEGEYGYCTEFLVRGAAIDVGALQNEVLALGDSALVVGDGAVVRVHVHTFDPGAILSAAARRGTLHRVKIDNMAEQHREFLLGQPDEERQLTDEAQAVRERRHAEASPLPVATASQFKRTPFAEVSMVVVASGTGCAELFRSLGAAVVVPGGQTMNPSTRELLEAVEAAPASAVVLLPNNGNIVPTAQQAVPMSDKKVLVVPTRTIPQGIAALMAFNYEASLEDNARVMTEAAQRVRTVEVTWAVRDAKVDGVEVASGNAIAVLDGELVGASNDLAAVALEAVERAGAASAELVTVMYGEESSQASAEALADSIGRRWPSLCVEIVNGGQPHYPFVISVE
ncbi:MAG: DAK2 domain-containing protein [Chloroflexota bacterium]